MAAQTFFPYSDGSGIAGNKSGQIGIGAGRLFIKETAVDVEANTSTVRVSYQILISGSATAFPWSSQTFPLYGSINVDGQTAGVGGSVSLYWTRDYREIWYKEFVIPHNRNGSKTITVEVSGTTYGIGGICARLYSNGKEYVNALGVGSCELELTKIDAAAPAYIGGVEYEIYIGNGTAFERYEPMIADGSEFK